MEPHTHKITVHTNRQKHSLTLTQEHTISADPQMLHDETARREETRPVHVES